MPRTKKQSFSYDNIQLYKTRDTIKLYQNTDGTRLAIMPNKSDSSSIGIYFYLKIGSKFEPININGISHFIEHMVYKGSKKLKTYIDITKTLDAAGISYNAFTAKDMTAYFYKFLVNSDNINLICRITYEMLFHSLFREKDIKLEREVVIEEYNDGIDDIDEIIDDKIDEELFKGHPLSMTIIGDRKSLHNINRTELLKFYKTHYRLDNLVIGVCGNIPSNVISIIERYFKKFKLIDIKIPHPTTFIPFIDTQSKYSLKFFPKSLKQDYINIIFKTGGYFDNNNVKYWLIKYILGANMSSRLFVEIREKLGLVYSISCKLNNYEEIGLFEINMQSEAKDTVLCIDKVLKELVKISKLGISNKELIENKKNLCDSIISSFDDIQVENEYYCKQILLNKPVITIKEKIAAIQNITALDIQQCCEQLFNINKMSIIWYGKTELKHVETSVKKYC